MIKRSVLGLVVLSCLSAWAPRLWAGTISQRAAENYVAFEAEDADTLGVGGGWRIIDLTTPYAHPKAGSGARTPILLPPGSNASSGAALLTDYSAVYTSIAVYPIDFATTGTYRLYVRDSAIEDGNNAANYGNEDSFNRPTAFDAAPNTAEHGYSGQTEGTYGWRNTGDNYTVSATGVAEFRIRGRESGYSVDRILFSQATNLSGSQLDALLNWDVPLTHFTDADPGDSNWETAPNWTSGAPTATTAAYIGDGHTTATLSQAGQQAQTLHVGHTDATLPGSGTLTQTGGDLTVLERLAIGRNTAGTAAITGDYTATGGTLAVGQLATGRAELYLGDHTATTAANGNDAQGTLDLSAVAQFDAYLASLVLGRVTSGSADNYGRAAGTLRLAGTNNIDATEIMISWSNMHRVAQLQSTVELGQTNNIQADRMTVGGWRGRADVRFAAPGGTLTLTGSSGAAADLRVAYTDLNTGSSGVGTMDLTGGTFNATLDELVIGYHQSKGGTDTGTLTFDAGLVTANTVTIGSAGVSGDGRGNAVGTMNMDGGTFTAGAIVLGTGAGNGTGTIHISDGTLTCTSLALGQGATHATYGDGTGIGTLEVGGGTVNINGPVTMGTGTAASSGTIQVTGSGVTVTGGVTTGVGASTVNVDNGTMDVTGDFKVDDLRVGYNGGTATLTVTGGDVEVGTGANTVDIGRRNGVAAHTQGTLDLSGAASARIDVANLRLGYGSGSSGGLLAKGTLVLSAAGRNEIDATAILIGDSPNAGNIGGSTVNLGLDNTIHVDTLTVGGRKTDAVMDILSGGTLALSGKSGPAADVWIAYNNAGTGSQPTGRMDLSGGTLNATIDELIIGLHNSGTGGATGELIVDAGTVTANTMTLGRPNASGSSSTPSKTSGTLTLNGGSFAVGTGEVGRNGGVGAVNQSGGAFSAGTLTIGLNGGTGTVTATGGTVQAGASGALNVGRRAGGGDSATNGTMDLSGAASVAMDLDELNVATVTADTNGNTTGTLTLSTAGANTLDAATITLGDMRSGPTPTTLGTLHLGGSNTIRTDTFYVGRQKARGAVDIVPGGTLSLAGPSGAEADLYVGYNDTNTTSTVAQGTMDLTGGTFNATLDELVIGLHGYPWNDTTSGSGTGTLAFDAGTVDANTVTIGTAGINPTYNRHGRGVGTLNLGGGVLNAGSMALATGADRTEATINLTGGAIHVAGNVTSGIGTSTVNVDSGTMDVTGDFKVDNLRVGYNGATGTLTVTGGDVEVGTGTNTVDIGRRASGSGNCQGTLDASGASSVDINASALRIGTLTQQNSTSWGTLVLSQAGGNTITAGTLLMGDSPAAGNTGQTSRMTLGGSTNVLKVDEITVGGRKSKAEVDIVAGGTVTLTNRAGTGAADLYIGRNNHNTGTNVVGVMDLSGATFDAVLDQLELGRHDAGSGSGKGTLIMDAGAVSANSVVLGRPNANGTSSNPTNTQGTITLNGGSLTAGSMTIGLNGGVGVLTATGGTVQVGAGSGDNLYVGRRTGDVGTSTGVQFASTLDVSGATSFTANVGTFGVAYVTERGGELYPTGTVVLSPSNAIIADTMIVADSPTVGLRTEPNKVTFGAANAVSADTVTIGGSKGVGVADIVPGGVLDLAGKSGARADVYVGRQLVATKWGSTGTLDMSGGTFNAQIGQLVIGTKPEIAGGTTVGVVTMVAGEVDANAITLGERTTAGTTGSVKGTFNLAGGTLTAGAIVKGAGNGNNGGDEANFNFTGGVLHVGTFGFTLDQDGGTLAPGASIDTTHVLGDYNLNAGVLEIEMNALVDQGDADADTFGYDFVDVTGNARLNAALMPRLIDGYKASEGDVFDVLTAADVELLTGFGLTYPAGQGGAFVARVIPGGNGEILQLQFVPEPATLAALLAGAAGLAGYLRRRRRA